MLFVLADLRANLLLPIGMFKKHLYTNSLLSLCFNMTELCVIVNLRLFYCVDMPLHLSNLYLLWQLGVETRRS